MPLTHEPHEFADLFGISASMNLLEDSNEWLTINYTSARLAGRACGHLLIGQCAEGNASAVDELSQWVVQPPDARPASNPNRSPLSP